LFIYFQLTKTKQTTEKTSPLPKQQSSAISYENEADFEAKREASTNALGAMMLRGYAMLEKHCSSCQMPLLREPRKCNPRKIVCVNECYQASAEEVSNRMV
jgi:hypothetical protein